MNLGKLGKLAVLKSVRIIEETIGKEQFFYEVKDNLELQFEEEDLQLLFLIMQNQHKVKKEQRGNRSEHQSIKRIGSIKALQTNSENSVKKIQKPLRESINLEYEPCIYDSYEKVFQMQEQWPENKLKQKKQFSNTNRRANTPFLIKKKNLPLSKKMFDLQKKMDNNYHTISSNFLKKNLKQKTLPSQKITEMYVRRKFKKPRLQRFKTQTQEQNFLHNLIPQILLSTDLKSKMGSKRTNTIQNTYNKKRLNCLLENREKKANLVSRVSFF